MVEYVVGMVDMLWKTPASSTSVSRPEVPPLDDVGRCMLV